MLKETLGASLYSLANPIKKTVVRIEQKPDDSWCFVIPMIFTEDHEIGGHPSRYDAETKARQLGFAVEGDE